MKELLDTKTKSIEFKKIILKEFLTDKFYLVKELNNKCSLSEISEMEFYLDKDAKFKLYNKKTFEEDKNAVKTCSFENFYSVNESFDITSFYQNENNKPVDDTKSKTLIFGEKCIQINDFINKMNEYYTNIENLKNIIELIKDLSINYNFKKSKDYYRKITTDLNDSVISELLSKKFIWERDNKYNPECKYYIEGDFTNNGRVACKKHGYLKNKNQ